MKKLTFILVLLFIYNQTKAQTFQFKLFFTDGIGNKDTLILGYDEKGTENIDTLFKEKNIVGTPLKSDFDVRISDAFFHNGIANYHTKKQILPDSCAGRFFPIVSIDIKCKNWPVTATWDSASFTNQCREGSVFTSFHPGGWWDVLGFPSDLYRVEFAKKNKVTFTSNYDPKTGFKEKYAYVNSSNDTIPVFWMAFGNLTLPTLALEKISNEFNSYPNPVKDFLTFDLQKEIIQEVHIVDMMGRSEFVDYKNGKVDLRNYNSGYYLLTIHRKDGMISTWKIVKE